jgi:hypothetical protein
MPVETRAMAKRRRLNSQIVHHPIPASSDQHYSLQQISDLIRTPLSSEVPEVKAFFQTHTTLFSTFPKPLRTLYEIHGSVCESASLGAVQDWWTLMSLQTVYETFIHHQKWNPICRSLDIAYIYHGMGYIIVASVDIQTGKMYLRMDGGSNGWDAELNYQFASNYQPGNDNCIEAEDWFDLVRRDRRGEEYGPNEYIVSHE